MAMQKFRRVAQLWNWLPGFRGVAEHENVHKAAQVLGVSPSALSRTVKLLEEALGAPLFVRQGSGMQLTTFGAELLAITRDVMRQVDDCIARDEARRGSVGPTRIGVTSEVAAAAAARALVPSTSTLHVVRIAEAVAIEELLQGNVDLVVLGGLPNHPQLIGDRLGETRRGIYAAPDHALARGLLTEEALAAAKYVGTATDPIGSEIACYCDSLEIARAICESSLLLCVLPDLLVRGGSLTRLADHGTPIILHALRRRPVGTVDELATTVERLRAALA